MTKTTRIVCPCILCAGIFFLLSNTMARVGKSLPASKAFSIATLLYKLDCMQFNCIQSFFGVLGEGAFREGTGRAEREKRGSIERCV